MPFGQTDIIIDMEAGCRKARGKLKSLHEKVKARKTRRTAILKQIEEIDRAIVDGMDGYWTSGPDKDHPPLDGKPWFPDEDLEAEGGL